MRSGDPIQWAWLHYAYEPAEALELSVVVVVVEEVVVVVVVTLGMRID